MAAFLIDNFTDVDGTNLTAHTPDRGGTWALQAGQSGGGLISTNRCYPSGSTVMTNSATQTSADYDVSADIYVYTNIGTFWGVIGRASNVATTMYGLALSLSGGTYTLQMSRWVNGAFATLSNVALPSQPLANSAHKLRLRMIGNQISGYYDDVQLIAPVTDGNITTAGLAGIHMSGTGSTSTGIHIDSINAASAELSYPPLTIPNRRVGPMALRNQFRRATAWTPSPDPNLNSSSVSTDISVGLTAGGVSDYTPSFITRDPATGYLMLDGTRFRFAGNNADIGLSQSTSSYGETDLGGYHVTSHAAIDDFITAMVGMNARVTRVFMCAIGITGSFMPTINTYDHAALDVFDYLIQQCAAYNIKIIGILSDDYDYFFNGKFDWCTLSGVTPDGNAHEFFSNATVIANFKAYVSAQLNHTNAYTGVKYKDDPVFLAWESGNELSDNTNRQSLSDWTLELARYIKVDVGAKQLFLDGKWSILGPANTVPESYMNNQLIDIYTEHTYDQWRTPDHMANQAAITHNYGKAFIVGEYSGTGKNGSGATIPVWQPVDMIAGVEGNANVDGDLFWQLFAQGNTSSGYPWMIHYPGDDATMIALATAYTNHGVAMNSTTLTNATFPTKTATLISPDQDVSKWTARSTASISGGQIVLPTGDTAYSSAVKYDLSDSSIVVEMVQKNPGTGSSSCGMYVQATQAPYTTPLYTIMGEGANIRYRQDIGGASDVSETYNPIAHRWLRIRTAPDTTYFTAYPYTSGTVYFETSADGIHWVVKRTITSSMVLTSVYAVLFNWNWGPDGTSGTAIFDNFNNAPPPDLSPQATIPNKYVGPMALREAFRRPDRWAEGPVTAYFGAADTPITVGLTADGVVGMSAVSPVGIDTGQAVGAISTTLSISPVGIPSTETAGASTGTISISPAGIDTAQAAGISIITPGAVSVSPTAIPSSETAGAQAITPGAVSVSPVGIPSSETDGAQAVTPGAVSVSPVGITTGQAAGAITTTPGAVSISPVGIPSLETDGASTVTPGAISISPVGIPSVETDGASTVTPGTATVSPAGVLTAEKSGAQTLTISVSPIAIPSSEIAGASTVAATVSPAGILTAETSGAQTVTLVVSPAAIPSSETAGAQAITPGAVSVSPAAILTSETEGTSTVAIGAVTLTSVGIGTSQAVGAITTTSVVTATGIASTETSGVTAVNQNVAVAGIGSDERAGASTTTPGAVTVAPSAILTSELAGQAVTTPGTATVSTTGITTAETSGSVSLSVSLSVAGIGSDQRAGASSVTPGTVTLATAGVGSAETSGTQTVTPGVVTVSPVGVESAQAAGTHALGVGLVVTGIGSEQRLGTSTGSIGLAPLGIGPAETLGAITSTQTVSPSGIPGEQANGAVALGIGVVAAGIGSEQRFGVPVATVTSTVAPAGIDSAERSGTAAATPGAVTVAVAGITPGESLGDSSISVGASTIVAASIVTVEKSGAITTAPGTATVSPTGIDSGETSGAIGLTQRVAPAAIASDGAVGLPAVTKGVTPTGIDTTAPVGSIVLTQVISPGGITTGDTTGVVTVIPGTTSVTATGILSIEVVNSPVITIIPGYIVFPVGIRPTEAFGVPISGLTVTAGGIGSSELVGARTSAAFWAPERTWTPGAQPTSTDRSDSSRVWIPPAQPTSVDH